MNIRKHISIVLSSLILFANIGLALNVHYCHNEVTAVSFAYKLVPPLNEHNHKHEGEDKKSCCGATESSKKCCKDDVVKLQDTTDHAIVKSLQLDLGAFYIVSNWKPMQFFAGYTPSDKKETPSFYCDSNAPPLYKLYCKYVLYA